MDKKNDKKEVGIIKIYKRGLNLIGDEAPEGPRLHPIIKDWDENYYELAVNTKGNLSSLSKDLNALRGRGKIEILRGKKKDMSETTQIFLKEKPKPNETVKVNKKKFLDAIKKFSKDNNGTIFHLFDFSDNCIGFKNCVLKKSKI